MATKRTATPWMKATDYGATLTGASLNLIVREVAPSVRFCTELLGFKALYSDVDYAALEGHGLKVQLHADHTWEHMPWNERLSSGQPRGLGIEVRVLGLDPDEVEEKARALGVKVMVQSSDFHGHGWRECYLEDPDGYVWVAGRLLRSAEGG